ncbi:MAG: hypothetical protein QXH81_10070 [Thermofilaceae archaeon]
MMVKVEKVVGGYRVTIGDDVILAREVLVDDDSLNDIEEYENAEVVYVDAGEVRKEGDVLRVYTLLYFFDTALERHVKYLLGGIKITMGRW